MILLFYILNNLTTKKTQRHKGKIRYFADTPSCFYLKTNLKNKFDFKIIL